MVQTATLLHAKAERLLGIGFDFRQSENSGVVAMATADDFVSDIVNVQQRRLTANFGDKSTDPLQSLRAINHSSYADVVSLLYDLLDVYICTSILALIIRW